MRLLRAIAVLALALLLQASAGHLWPPIGSYVDLLMIPVVWYGNARSQRSAMLVGCAAGLLQDAWFQTGTFGLNGFKKTALGWLLGGLAGRLDLNHAAGRWVAGVGVAVGDRLLGMALRRLLDQDPGWPDPLGTAIFAVTTGLLVATCGEIVERMRGGRAIRRPA